MSLIKQKLFKHLNCSGVLKQGRSNDQINCNEKIFRKNRFWLKENKLMVIDADKGRATCIIAEKQ